jgi:hypothetical protein
LANCLFGAAVLNVQDEVAEFAQGITRFKKAALWATEPVTAWPAGFTMPMGLPPVSHAGVVALITLLVKRIKAHPAYTKQIGEELGIEGPDTAAMAPAAMAELKPVLKVRLEAGQPNILWKKQGMDALELHVDRGGGQGFVLLDVDDQPDYLDLAPLPAAGVSAVWKFKAIYRQAGQRVGQWSDELKVSVMGV